MSSLAECDRHWESMADEWMKSERFRTLDLWARKLCADIRHSGYRQDSHAFAAEVDRVKLERRLHSTDYRYMCHVLGDCFRLIDPRDKESKVPRSAFPYCGLYLRGFWVKNGNWTSMARLLTHPLWLEGGLDVHAKIEAYKKSEEYKQAVQMEQIKSILADAAPPAVPSKMRVKVKVGKPVPAFAKQTP